MADLSDIIIPHPEFCNLETRLSDLKYILSKYNYEELVIVDLNKHPIGFVNKEAVSDEALKFSPNPFNIKAENLMNMVSVSASSNLNAEECLKLMNHHHLSAIPVIDDSGKCIGVVHEFDLKNKITHLSPILS
jgi:CBS domain-containing protein